MVSTGAKMNKPISAILLASSYLAASPCTINPGIVECKDGNMDGLTASGVAKMTSTNFVNQVEIFGDLNANSCKFTGLQVHGNTNIEASTIKQRIELYGMLNMHNCNATDTMKLYSDNAEIYNSNLKEILMYGNNTPCIILENSTVHGDITFHGSNGKVKCLGQCNIEGKIINGTLVKTGEENA